MAEPVRSAEEHFEVEPLSTRDYFVEVITAAGISTGLALLWGLENVRNGFFHLLDRMNLKPRPRHASAFPPGRERQLKH